MTLVLLAPIISIDATIAQDYSLEEWFRPLKPNGQPYGTFDHITAKHGHFGEDLHDDTGRIFAGIEGWAHYRNWGYPLGIQTEIQDARSGLSWLACHQARRRIQDGQRVDPDTYIGDIGGTGGVPIHLHSTSYITKNGYGWFNGNWPGALTSMKGELMALADDVAAKVLEAIKPELQYLHGAIETGGNSHYPGVPGGHSINDVKADTAAIKSKLGA